MKKIVFAFILLVLIVLSYLKFSSHSIPEEKQISSENLRLKLKEKPYTHLLFITSWCVGKDSHIDIYKDYLETLKKDSITFIVLASDANFEAEELDLLKEKGFETYYISKLNSFPLLDKYNVKKFVTSLEIPFEQDIDFNSSPIDLLYDRKVNMLITEPTIQLFQLNNKTQTN